MSQSDSTDTKLVRLDEHTERMSHQQIREMADVFRLTDEDLDDKRIIYPRMRDKNVLNQFREIRTKLIERSRNQKFALLVTAVG